MASRCKREEFRKGHTYAIDGQRVPGVTTVLNTAIAKPGLIIWAARQGAIWARELGTEVHELSEGAFMEQAGKAPDRVRDAKAKRGTKLHEYAELLGKGEELEPDSELAHEAQHVAHFLDRWQAHILAQEVVVWHEAWKYAGTFDVLADLATGEGGRPERWLLDYKTGSGIYPEMVMQLAAYRFASHAVVSDADVPMAQVQRVGIVHVSSAGAELKPVHANLAAFEAFCNALQLTQWLNSNRDPAPDALPHPAQATS